MYLIHGPPVFSILGDGTGGSERYLRTTASKRACAVLVMLTVRTANGATWGPSNKRCYAEFGATGHNSASSWVTCMFRKDYTQKACKDQPALLGQLVSGATCSGAKMMGMCTKEKKMAKSLCPRTCGMCGGGH